MRTSSVELPYRNERIDLEDPCGVATSEIELSTRLVSSSTKSGHLPKTAPPAPNCKQSGNRGAACAHPRRGYADGRSRASAQRPARRSDRTMLRSPSRSLLHQIRWTCGATPRSEPRSRPRSCVTMRRVGLRAVAHADRFPDHPDVTTEGAFTVPAFRRRRGPRPRASDDRSFHHLVPYQLDTPTTSKVSPRDRRMFSEGWSCRLPLMIRSVQLHQLCPKRRL